MERLGTDVPGGHTTRMTAVHDVLGAQPTFVGVGRGRWQVGRLGGH